MRVQNIVLLLAVMSVGSMGIASQAFAADYPDELAINVSVPDSASAGEAVPISIEFVDAATGERILNVNYDITVKHFGEALIYQKDVHSADGTASWTTPPLRFDASADKSVGVKVMFTGIGADIDSCQDRDACADERGFSPTIGQVGKASISSGAGYPAEIQMRITVPEAASEGDEVVVGIDVIDTATGQLAAKANYDITVQHFGEALIYQKDVYVADGHGEHTTAPLRFDASPDQGLKVKALFTGFGAPDEKRLGGSAIGTQATVKITEARPLVETTTVTPGESGGGCLIATAAYGSEMAPQVQFLREIRDGKVMATQSGTAFMTGFNQFYYSFSPAVADYERDNPVFKEAVKLTLTPMLTSLALLNYVDVDTNEKMLGWGISLILLNIGMYFVAPAAVIGIVLSIKSKRSRTPKL